MATEQQHKGHCRVSKKPYNCNDIIRLLSWKTVSLLIERIHLTPIADKGGIISKIKTTTSNRVKREFKNRDGNTDIVNQQI